MRRAYLVCRFFQHDKEFGIFSPELDICNGLLGFKEISHFTAGGKKRKNLAIRVVAINYVNQS